MASKTMHCARCGTEHPWEPALWPSMTYAVCWPCTLKEAREGSSRDSFTQLVANVLFGAFGFSVGVALTAVIMAP